MGRPCQNAGVATEEYDIVIISSGTVLRVGLDGIPAGWQKWGMMAYGRKHRKRGASRQDAR